MQKEIRSKVLILSMFFLVFSGFGVLMLLASRGREDDTLLYTSSIFLFVGLCAFYFIIKMIQEVRLIKEPFYNLSENKADALTQERAEKLQEQLNGLRYIVQTNDKGFRVIEDFDETQLAKLEQGKKVYTRGYNFLKTSSKDKYKELAIDIEYSKVDGKINEKVNLIGGKSFSFSSNTVIERDENGKIKTTSTGLVNNNVLQEVISEVKDEDGWKTSFDAESKFALIMAILGGGGAILTIILLIYQSIANK